MGQIIKTGVVLSVVGVAGMVCAFQAWAGVVEMPEIVDVPALEKKTMVRDLNIPSVKKRDIDPLSGPRLAVSQFRIQGLLEYPELGITQAALEQMVEEIRTELMAEDEYLPSGYTISELSEISNLLGTIEDETRDRHVTSTDVQRLIWLVRDQQSRRGILLSQIESVADKITQFYRERGFILAKAYIPKQKVRDGVVNLTLMVGVLGEVKSHGNRLYSDQQLSSVFKGMMTNPVTSDVVEENLYLINDYPGINADGYFEPGLQVGDTRININVKNEDRYNANIRFDNHGTDQTGLYRLYGEVQGNNMLGYADLLKLSLLAASRPNNTQYWRLNYQAAPFGPRFKVGVGLSKNQFIVDQSVVLTSIDLSGVVNVKDLGLTYVMKRSRVENYTLSMAYDRIESDLQIGTTPDVERRLDEELENISLQFDFDVLNESSRMLHQGNVKLAAGSFVFGVDPGQDSSYKIVSADYTALMFWKLPFFGSDTRVIMRSNAQYSGANLSSIVRFSLAGASRVRAFSPNLYSADDAVHLGVDWVFNNPVFLGFNKFKNTLLQESLKPMLFADYGWGRQYSLVQSEDDVRGQLGSVGLGFQFAYGSQLKGDLLFAFPVENKFSKPDVASADNDVRLIFDIQYGF